MIPAVCIQPLIGITVFLGQTAPIHAHHHQLDSLQVLNAKAYQEHHMVFGSTMVYSMISSAIQV
jgi:hypothetical protein